MIACATRCRALELSRCFITQWWFQSCFSKSVTARAKANVVYWRVLLRGLMSAVARCHEAAHLSRNRFTVPPTDNSAAASALERV
jgi:hypothetical protein